VRVTGEVGDFLGGPRTGRPSGSRHSRISFRERWCQRIHAADDIAPAPLSRENRKALSDQSFTLMNIWLTINGGGGPTDDKPEVVASPPRDPNVLSMFLNLRVTDIKRYYELWPSRREIHH
jgi:hypothetical protein